MTPNGGSQEKNHIFVSVSIAVVFLLIFLLVRIDQSFFAGASLYGSLPKEEFSGLDLGARAVFEYQLWVLEHSREAFEWQLRSSKYLFWVSVSVAISGICFAFWQFVRADDFSRYSEEADSVDMQTAFAKISFRARSMAAFVMLMSIVYLLVYVLVVYQIEYLPNAKSESQENTIEVEDQGSGIIDPDSSPPPPTGSPDG